MARKLDQILVVDVESTCWDGPPPENETSEILEIGLCTVDVASLERIEKHSILIAPERSTISQFCTELTTLTPDMFSNAGSLCDAAKRLKNDFRSKDRLWASWGDYDRRQFERTCQVAGVGYPFGLTHLNIKSLFAITLGLAHEVGLDTACQKLGIEMEGTHHRGDDDAWNIAGILCHILHTTRINLK
ncbi:3'-5' exonuclease [Aporhodopirellula aestuarii]|uniref:Exonuclease domain-containing protein n=1 Tax=Aporhodopirellula aestuarii TaxID=2950107 RepID=A0ABT0U244_9BACT|nr:3'-5' exonuclease [Aporhodopirellula aestuarii]MCM2370972.1 exonuclease domain-containing protein [Aporhodopirellula aestuarii]